MGAIYGHQECGPEVPASNNYSGAGVPIHKNQPHTQARHLPVLVWSASSAFAPASTSWPEAQGTPVMESLLLHQPLAQA